MQPCNRGIVAGRYWMIATLTALMLFAATPVVAGDWEDASSAIRAGDYQKAFRLWKPLAEKGYARAQHNLGVMYRRGECAALKRQRV